MTGFRFASGDKVQAFLDGREQEVKVIGRYRTKLRKRPVYQVMYLKAKGLRDTDIDGVYYVNRTVTVPESSVWIEKGASS